jgi:hypothetical protein
MVCGGDVLLDTQQLAEFSGELWSEPRVVVANDFRGEAVPGKYMFGVQGCCFFSGYLFYAGDEDGGFQTVMVRDR